MKRFMILLAALSVLSIAVLSAAADDSLTPGMTAELPAGVYKAGTDFPEGAYILDCGASEEGCCYSYGSASMRRLFNGYDYSGEGAYQICSYDEEGPVHLVFETGDVLQSGASLSLTVAEPVSIPTDEPVRLKNGFYRAGKDIPVGAYSIHCTSEDWGCGLDLSSDSLLKLGSSSDGVLQQYIHIYLYSDTDYHFFLEEDGIFRVGNSTELTAAEPVNFK